MVDISLDYDSIGDMWS